MNPLFSLIPAMTMSEMARRGITTQPVSAHTPHTKAGRQQKQREQRRAQERNRKTCNQRNYRRGR